MLPIQRILNAFKFVFREKIIDDLNFVPDRLLILQPIREVT